MSYINADRAHRRLVTQPETNCVREVSKYILQRHIGIDVAGVIERRAPQIPPYKRCWDTQREAQLGVQDHKLLAAHGHCDLYAAAGIVRRTDQDFSLRSSPVQTEAA